MKTVGSRAEVWHGTAKKTSGGLLKKDLKKNKRGRIVSKKMSNRAKKEKRLEKAGYKTKKGKFTLFKAKKKRGGMMSNSGLNNLDNLFTLRNLSNIEINIRNTKNVMDFLGNEHKKILDNEKRTPANMKKASELFTEFTNAKKRYNKLLKEYKRKDNQTKKEVMNSITKTPYKLKKLTNNQLKFLHETAKKNYEKAYPHGPPSVLKFRQRLGLRPKNRNRKKINKAKTTIKKEINRKKRIRNTWGEVAKFHT